MADVEPAMPSGVYTDMAAGCVMLVYAGLVILDGAPRTIRFEAEFWKNSSWGVHNFERRSAHGTVAISADGSRRTTAEARSYAHILIPGKPATFGTLYLRSANTAYSLDDGQKTARAYPCDAGSLPAPPTADDARCTRTAHGQSRQAAYAGEDTISGRRVVRYRETNADGSEERLAYVPDLACELFERVRVRPGTFGIPTHYERYRVTAYQPGEPPADQLRIPHGYTIIPRHQ